MSDCENLDPGAGARGPDIYSLMFSLIKNINGVSMKVLKSIANFQNRIEIR